MKKKRNFGDRVFDLFNTLILLFLVVIMIYPLWHVAMASFSNSAYLMAHDGLLLFPLEFNLDAYKMVFKNPNILTGYANTILIVVCGTLGSTFCNMSYFAGELKNGETESWQQKAVSRKEKMLKYMDDGSGILLDYNFVTDSLSDIFSAASIYPLFVKMADKKHAEALVDKLCLLETDYGILTCAQNRSGGDYQWYYPNGWACLQYIAMVGLDHYGYRKEAKRIAEKFVNLVDHVYEQTGNIWEKYNVVDGNICVKNEYDMPAMMGWTAGVYLCAGKYIEETIL